MRQFFGWRFWAAVLALVVVALAIVVLTGDDSASEDQVERSSQNRRLDLASFVYAAERNRFRMTDGYSRGYLNLILDGERTVRIQPGTPGVVRCQRLDEVGGCGVVADLLGDAVVWFAIVPLGPRLTLELPPIVDLEDGYAILSNGWELRYAPVLDRRCDEQTESFQQFLREFGPRSTTIVDPGENRVTAVAC
ncbi:MAG: hypothetical protein H0V69_15795 [Acidimicrobiia bacterium]|jgi:hypothetical protein|nr:hypothetical protein [Acidimicrobiia bacterium]